MSNITWTKWSAFVGAAKHFEMAHGKNKSGVESKQRAQQRKDICKIYGVDVRWFKRYQKELKVALRNIEKNITNLSIPPDVTLDILNASVYTACSDSFVSTACSGSTVGTINALPAGWDYSFMNNQNMEALKERVCSIQPQVSESTATQVINDISFAISDPNLTRTTEHNVLNSFEPNSQEHSFLDYRNQSIAEISSDIFNRRIYLESFDHEQGIENIEPEERRFTNETDEDFPSFYIHDSKIDRIKADLRIKEAQTMLSKKKLEKYDLNFELKKRIATENETIEEAKLSKVLNIEELKEKIEKKKRKRELRRQE